MTDFWVPYMRKDRQYILIISILALVGCLTHFGLESSDSLWYYDCTYWLLGKFPHKMAYRDVVLDFTKILVIWWLIGFGLLGFILSVLIAQGVYLCYIFYVTKDSFRGGFNFKRLKRWLSFSWNTLYGLVGSNVYDGLSVVFLGMLLSASALGSYGVTLTIARLLEMTLGLSSALYPKLLGEEASREDSIMEAMALVLMFLIPMTAGCILLAPNLIEING